MSDDTSLTPPAASIVIPTYDGARRALMVLRSLAQGSALSRGVEVIVVDNASTEDVEPILSADRAWRDLPDKGMKVRVVREPVAGLTPARLRGIREAASDIICFLDDDTVPCDGYVAIGIAAFEDPTVGMLTSRVFPRYEVEPSPAIARREHMLAINRLLGDQQLDWGAEATVAPTIGAGMWLRRQAIQAALEQRERWLWLSDRKGASLSSGGDIEFGVMVGAAGFRRIYVPSLRLEHLIPASRVEMPYFRRLVASVVRSHLALVHRYPPHPWGARDRWRAIGRFCGAVLAIPILLLREDGWREMALVLTARRAEMRGPE